MKYFDKIGILILIGLLSYLSHRKEINEFPSYIHSWAQSDRYALAIGFTQNDFNFFLPQTYNLNPQFPGKFMSPKNNGITAVDFPIHDYIAALIMGLSGETAPWCFRLYMLIYSIIGLLYLYLLSNFLTESIVFSFFITIFALSSPVFSYYQAGFLPSIPSLANLFIALYFYFKYRKSNNFKAFILSILFFTLSALSRTPFAIFLIAVICHETIQSVSKRNFNLRIFGSFLIAISVIVGYFLYNIHLREAYGSIFLSHPLPPKSLSEAYDLLIQTSKNWFFQYFTVFHYIFIAFIISLLSITRIFTKEISPNTIRNQLILYVFIAFFGTLFYFILMMKQFPAHDYYFLDTFYAVFILGLIWLLGFVKFSTRLIKTISYLILFVFGISFVLKSNNIQKVRRQTGSWDRIDISRQNFTNSDSLLKSLEISESANILVIDSYTPNIPFILMNRKGYALMKTTKCNIIQSLDWKYDYIVIQDFFLMTDVVRNYPEIINRIEKIGGNGKISVYKKLNEPRKTSMNAFLKFNETSPILTNQINFDTIPNKYWQNTNSIPNKSLRKNIGILTDNDEFGITFSIKNLKPLSQKQHTLIFKGQFLIEENIEKVWAVVSVAGKEENQFYRTVNLGQQFKSINNWEKIYLIFSPIPQIINQTNELKVYIWNEGRQKMFYDDLAIVLY